MHNFAFIAIKKPKYTLLSSIFQFLDNVTRNYIFYCIFISFAWHPDSVFLSNISPPLERLSPLFSFPLSLPSFPLSPSLRFTSTLIIARSDASAKNAQKQSSSIPPPAPREKKSALKAHKKPVCKFRKKRIWESSLIRMTTALNFEAFSAVEMSESKR